MCFGKSSNRAVCSLALRFTKIYERNNHLGQEYKTGKTRVTERLVVLEKIKIGPIDFSGRIFFVHWPC